MAEPERVSVVVITFDEEANLDRCLAGVDWADEIVVVDSGSTDATLEIARRHGARVIEQAWPGYVEQKNLGIDRASHRWVLSLDADEWLTAEAAEEIRRVLQAPHADGYEINRLTRFCGRWLHHAWSPDRQLRLFRRDLGRFAGGRVHESVRMQPGSRVSRLQHRLRHDAYRSVAEYVERSNRYSTLAAQTLAEGGDRFPWSRLLLSPPAAFVKFYLLRRGFLDGLAGLVVSVGGAFYALLKYAKLWELRRAGRQE